MTEEDEKLMLICLQLGLEHGFFAEDAGTDDEGMARLEELGLVCKLVFRWFVTKDGWRWAENRG